MHSTHACESYSDSICFQFTGIQDLSSNFFITPNPVIDYVLISGLSAGNNVSYQIWNMTGEKTILTGESNGASEIKLDCSGWSSGIYILQLTDQSGISRKKIMVLRE
jgi:hypothetical protein